MNQVLKMSLEHMREMGIEEEASERKLRLAQEKERRDEKDRARKELDRLEKETKRLQE